MVFLCWRKGHNILTEHCKPAQSVPTTQRFDSRLKVNWCVWPPWLAGTARAVSCQSSETWRTSLLRVWWLMWWKTDSEIPVQLPHRCLVCGPAFVTASVCCSAPAGRWTLPASDKEPLRGMSHTEHSSALLSSSLILFLCSKCESCQRVERDVGTLH